MYENREHAVYNPLTPTAYQYIEINSYWFKWYVGRAFVKSFLEVWFFTSYKGYLGFFACFSY